MKQVLTAWNAESRRLLALLEAAVVHPAAENPVPIERALGALPTWLDTRDRLLAEFAEARARGLSVSEGDAREIAAGEQALDGALKRLRDVLGAELQAADRRQIALTAYGGGLSSREPRPTPASAAGEGGAPRYLDGTG